MKILPHQLEISKQIQRKLLKYNLCLLAGEVRSGKTLAFIDAADSLYKKILIITTKKAMTDIAKIIPDNFDVINYHSCHKLHGKEYDCVILDEFHSNISSYPKKSIIWKKVFHFTQGGTPIIYSSGTPSPESYSMLFNPLSLSTNSIWSKYSRFTLWHEDYGKPYTMRLAGLNIKKYDRTKDKKIKKDIKKITITLDQETAGHKFFAKDKAHIITMNKQQIKIISKLDKNLIYDKKNYTILADTPAKLMQKKHQISGGFCKCEDDVLMSFKNNPKVKYINENFDPNKTIILAYFIAEQRMLATLYPNTGSVISNAEGVDYSHFEHMIIYSFGYSAKNYEQVRARQMNLFKRKTEINVNFLMTTIDRKIYDAVSNKKNFTRSWYK